MVCIFAFQRLRETVAQQHLEIEMGKSPADHSAPPRVEVIFSADAIAKRLSTLASEISRAEPEPLMVVAVLKGSFVFAADLIRALHKTGLEPEVDFLTLSSYKKSRVSSGTVDILRDLDLPVEGRNILLVDDVLDSGRTLVFAKDLLSARGAKSVKTCVLLDKKVARAVNVGADYRAFECDDVFVVGYGMDAAHRFRELPYVGRVVSE
jgi:hypoxanthine phosphoribosyltransferase